MVDLTSLNTLRVLAKARDLREIREIGEIREIEKSEPHLFLGHGANILFVHDFPGTVIKIELKGKRVVSQTDSEVVIEAMAGEDWHELVMWTVENNWSGLENMALIPGTVGAAVVGNIGAYGQEVKNTIQKVSSIKYQVLSDFDNASCEFEYRGSFFKHHQEYLVTAAQFKLSKKFKLNDSYIKFPDNCSLRQAFDFIVATRQQKLPDWTKTGTAGSFFKNPIVTNDQLSRINNQVEDLKTYGNKVPAGKLLDVLGWKDKKIGNVSTHAKSALVIINLGGATGQEIFDYAELMREDIKSHFGIDLEYEVRIV